MERGRCFQDSKVRTMVDHGGLEIGNRFATGKTTFIPGAHGLSQALGSDPTAQQD